MIGMEDIRNWFISELIVYGAFLVYYRFELSNLDLLSDLAEIIAFFTT